jgi:glucosamine--fructose-6-phosphate aminotransferase (isomerizing)
MSPTEQTIAEQFAFWRAAMTGGPRLPPAVTTAFVGCGTSYNLALSLAVQANLLGRAAIAAPGGEWARRPEAFCPDWQSAHLVALSRSGETTETVEAARMTRRAGGTVTAITVEEGSSIARHADQLVFAPTDPREGIVMTTSASLMLLLGLELLGQKVPASITDPAQGLIDRVDTRLPALIAGRSHFVYLGGGHLYGVGLEGALKLMEMSQTFTKAFHPLEYRHGPISLVDERTVAVMLYSADQREAESKLAAELQEKGARVIGFGGPGDASFAIDCDPAFAGLVCLPALQLLGERAAQARNIDTMAPRHLTKVVMLA